VRQWIYALSINLAICWKLRVSDGTRSMSHPFYTVGFVASSSENPIGADNQQERLDAGFAALKGLALTMNGGGRYRRVHRTVAPESSEAICQTLAPPAKIWSDLRGDT
jgi:hypothetical protein